MSIKKVVLAKPRGFCAGVERAIDIVERALAKYGPPVYVRHEIVHNKRVVEDLRAKGVTILMVEQNARRALEISTYGYVLDMGKNRHEGDGRQLAVDPEIVGIYFGKK